ncbi:LacI family DNA-binding transcriptional regulator [Mycolicibacterium sp. YH-1]|uniref:LacI family DNA-binding transcriptional regulator n=1 Tax=Mycolicibacterium sp. YH-1 TaxID=2908837 RepID=UPI001F4C4115|nr:LacI family DNA-binding transcriptional regulator [Mycolicibacterium sp. YH-1]UNB52529.1 LacI family transcriptional regulator [Mycolicibacterium sp. YH-1]
MAVSIRDVAAAAGVSLTTVSHVLSNQGRIGKDTRARVMQVAADLGYAANVHAQQLVTNRSRTLAIQVAPFDPDSGSSMLIPNSEYFLELLNGASEAAGRAGYALVLTPPGVGPTAITAFAVDGAIIVDPHGDEGLLDPAWTSSHPVVTAGRTATRRDSPYVVDNDHEAATTSALEHLWEQGFRRPAAMITDRARSYTRDVVAAYTVFAQQRGIPVRIIETGAGNSAGDALRALLDADDPPDAIYAGAEDIAMDVLQRATQLGIRVPTDLGLCSCVDSSTFNLTCPEVTGVFCHPRTIGERAVGLLIDLIDGNEPEDRVIIVPTELRARTSTLRRTA